MNSRYGKPKDQEQIHLLNKSYEFINQARRNYNIRKNLSQKMRESLNLSLDESLPSEKKEYHRYGQMNHDLMDVKSLLENKFGREYLETQFEREVNYKNNMVNLNKMRKVR